MERCGILFPDLLKLTRRADKLALYEMDMGNSHIQTQGGDDAEEAAQCSSTGQGPQGAPHPELWDVKGLFAAAARGEISGARRPSGCVGLPTKRGCAATDHRQTNMFQGRAMSPAASSPEPKWIDTAFDFRTDTPPPKVTRTGALRTFDPDTFSPTLARYHKLLWSKPLPSGQPFDLSITERPPYYLCHRSELGEFELTSDAVVPSFGNRRDASIRSIIASFPAEEHEAFGRLGYSIGGMMVFPGRRIGRNNTINGARGFHHQISDRFDLTLECIRLHYACQSSPLGKTLELYRDFFALFEDFRGYADFFLLQDIIESGAVRFSLPFDDFRTRPVPKDRDEYAEYRRRSIEFIEARNRRIEELQMKAR
jgi:hypothetical protein